MKKNEARTVWSSNQGDQRKNEIRKQTIKSLPPGQQTAYLHRESGGRGGKVVSIVKNLTLSEADMKSLAKKLKQNAAQAGQLRMV